LSPSGAATISIFIVDDVRLHRDGLAGLLAGDRRTNVVGGGGSSDQLLARIDVLKPDVVTLDLTAPDSLATARAIGSAVPSAKLVAVGLGDGEEMVLRCAEAGFVGFVPRDANLDQLVEAFESAMRGEVSCSPRMAATLLRRVATLAADQAAPLPEHRLTARELEIIELIDEGLTNKEIAARLTIEVATVKNHVHNILEKLEVRGRAEAAARVRVRGRALNRRNGGYTQV
jgi:two-component system, NarL family, nitrate/nitrite response regulator NarL